MFGEFCKGKQVAPATCDGKTLEILAYFEYQRRT